MIHQPFATRLSSSPNQFVPEVVNSLPGSSVLVRHTLLFAFFFKELISFMGPTDKCHTWTFNALIYLVMGFEQVKVLQNFSFQTVYTLRKKFGETFSSHIVRQSTFEKKLSCLRIHFFCNPYQFPKLSRKRARL